MTQEDTQFSVMRLSDLKDTEPQRDHGDLSGLKESVCKWGLLEPLVVTPEGGIIAGRRRFQALQEVGLDIVPVRIRNPKNAYERFLMAWDENRYRKAETWQEEAKNELLEKRLYEEQFPETKAGGDRRSPDFQVAKSATCSPETAPRYTEARAVVSGTSERTAQAKVEMGLALEKHPEIAGCKTESQARRKLRDMKRIANPPLPTPGKYRIIYADPPWPYEEHGVSVSENYGGAQKHYPGMSVEELCDLPVAGIAEKDSVLFLWVTSPKLNEAFPIIAAWGFTYKTSFVWDKVKHNFGFYNSVRHELLLIATRGSCLPEVSTLYDSVQSVERSDRHSEKPEEFRQLIDTLYPTGARIELFARGAIPAPWVAWGLEAGHA